MDLNRVPLRAAARRSLLAALLAGCAVAPPPGGAPGTRGDALASLPAELSLAGGDLRVVNLYRAQALALRDTAGHSPGAIVDRLVRTVYTPYPEFWQGYLGDEERFRRWASTALLRPDHPIHHTLPALLTVGLDSLFTEAAEWLAASTGQRPRGVWYLVYGPGWTDMGGLGGVGMVADFSRQAPDAASLQAILPHELAHQVHARRTADPDAGTVLERILSEGLAAYVSFVHGGGSRSEARSLGYTEAEWDWARAHEHQLVEATRPYLASTARGDLDRFAARNQHLVPEAPGAIGYFLGFRVVQAYVAREGPDAWKALLTLPVRTVLESSRHPLGVPGNRW